MHTKTIALSGLLSVALCMIGAADTGTMQRITAVSTQTTDRVDITTLSGVTYSNCRISRAEPDGITVFCAKGVAKIPFADLPEEYQTKYNYNPTNAAAYTRAVNQRQVEVYAEQQANFKKQQQQQTTAEEARRAADAAAKRSAASRPKTPPNGVVRLSEEQDAEIPSGQNVTVIIERKKTQSELLGDLYDRQYKAAEATKGIVRQVGESREAYEARRKAAIHAALGGKRGN